MLHNAGKDFVASSLGDTSGSRAAAAGWMAITANSTAPAAGDTSLTGEITTASGGLIRGTAAYAHTNGTSTYTLTRTFTANANDTGLPVTIAKAGIFNASSGGTMPWSSLLSPTATISAVGDSLTVTETITIS